MSFLKLKTVPRHDANMAKTEVEMNSVLRISLMNIRPKDFISTQEFSALRLEIDKRLDALFNGAVDLGNDNALDVFIQTQADAAKEGIKFQRAEHINLINDLNRQRTGDYAKKQRELTECGAKITDIDRQINELKQRLI